MPFPPALVVGAHLDHCPNCKSRVSQIEEAEGRLLESLPGADLAPGALERVLEKLDQTPQAPAKPRLHKWLRDVPIPQSVAALGVGSRRFLTPDFWIAPVPAAERDGWRTYILRAPAGAQIPTHEHRGGEFVCVLMGAFVDGRTYSGGDFAENPAGASHELQVTADGPCASLIASHGKSKWSGFARALTPLLGV